MSKDFRMCCMTRIFGLTNIIKQNTFHGLLYTLTLHSRTYRLIHQALGKGTGKFI